MSNHGTCVLLEANDRTNDCPLMVSMSDKSSGVRSVAGPVEAKSEVAKGGAQASEGAVVGLVVAVEEVVVVDEVVAVDEVVVAGELSGVAVVAGFARPGVTADEGE